MFAEATNKLARALSVWQSKQLVCLAAIANILAATSTVTNDF